MYIYIYVRFLATIAANTHQPYHHHSRNLCPTCLASSASVSAFFNPSSASITAGIEKYAPHLWKENASTIPFGGLFCKIPGSTTVVAVLNSNHDGVEYQNNVCLGFVHSSTPVAYPSCTWLQPWLAMICDPRAGYEPYATQELYYFSSISRGEYIPSNHLSYHQLVWELSTPQANSSEKAWKKNGYTSWN